MRISDWSSDVCSSDLERMILGGKVYSAEEMYDMGLVHVIAETGEGEQAVRDYISENNARHSGHVGVYRAGRRVNPLQLDELKELVEHWVYKIGRASSRERVCQYGEISMVVVA